ncbi:diguanylate cyclase [Chloroflexota bacterium]
MTNYALVPLVALIAYIPLLVTTATSRPWQRRHMLFILFLLPALTWSLFDYLLRGNFFPEHTLTLGKIIMASATLMFVQFHLFNTSFYPSGKGKWLPFAYISLALLFTLIALGFIPESIDNVDGRLVPNYGRGMIIYIAIVSVLTSRDFYVLWRRLKNVENPALYNQILSLMLGLGVLITLAIAGNLPFIRGFPAIHLGNLINAIILSYAVMRHRLVDIRIVLRQGTALASLGFIGIVTYLLLLIIFHSIFDFDLDLTAAFFAIIIAIMVALFIYRLRGSFFITMSRIFQGESYNDRWKLSDFANSIHNVFSLKKQGGELLELITKALEIKWACLLFPEGRNADFTPQIIEPRESENPLSNLKMKNDSPILKYLRREQKLLGREELSIKPEFLGLWEREKTELRAAEIELFIPLISRGKLISILVLGKKKSSRYALEDINLLQDVTERVAVSMEKEFLREQLREREEELSVLNRSSSIITSSLDIPGIFSSFIDELKRLVDISIAGIALAEGNNMCFLAVTPENISPWKVGEIVPVKGTMTEWVVANKKPLVEPDLSKENRFSLGKYFTKHGAVSVASLPLIAKGEAIGSLVIASDKPNAYDEKNIMVLEQLSSQIAMHVENARLYARVEEKARIDELTGLFNRRSLDEMMIAEIGRHSRYGGLFSLIILDLDTFKIFNDNYGHLEGDKLLKQIGDVVKGAIRTADQAFRYGGDEFAILLPQTAIDAARRVAERVRKHITLKTKTGHIPITASLGLASWPSDGISPTDIMAAADAALYNAKRSGGNRTHCASGTLLSMEEIIPVSKEGDGHGILSTIYALAATVDARDPSTIDHSKKVSEYALTIADSLNLSPKDKNRLEICALLHDVGKLGINDAILNKPGKLNEKEWEVVKNHPQLGTSIASRAPQLAPCLPGILHHHERYDGMGYPKGLKGDDIPLDARILAIADAFAAMTLPRPYATTLSQEEALEEIKRCAGTQFDPHLVEVFLSMMKATESLPHKKR